MKYPEYFRSMFFYAGPVCLTVVILAGFWISFGIHISLWPLYIDLHCLWFIFTIQSAARGRFWQGLDKEVGLPDW